MNHRSLTAEAEAQFRDGISLVLSRWAALRMAIENEWGGRDSTQKSQQLADNLFNLLTRSKGISKQVYIDDLEDLLDEFMDSLNTEIGDGSIEEVSLKLMEMHEECFECNFDSIKRPRETTTPTVSYIRQTPRTLKQLYLTSFSFISGIIVFGGLIAPILELKLGLGGTSYEDFIRKMHLPMQLSKVDPIVASFSGGAVGVISALMLLEINNVEQQEKKRCKYCHGTRYLACAGCSASGLCLSIEPIVTGASNRPLNAPTTKRCLNCSGAGKVMCPTCLCTGMIMASEHDPRIEPLGVKDRPYLGRPNRIDLLGSVRPSWS